MTTQAYEKIAEEAREILTLRGNVWGTFTEFVQSYSDVEDKFRMFFKDVNQMKNLQKYRLRNFIEKMLALKLTRALYVVKKEQGIDCIHNEYLRDCAVDFLNYCKLCETQFKFELHYGALKTQDKYLEFFDKILELELYGEEDSNED